MLFGSEADKAYVFLIMITELLVFALVSFLAAARDSVFMSKAAESRVVADGPGVLVPIPDRLAHHINDLRSFPIVCKMWHGTARSYVALYLVQEVALSCVDLQELFFLHCGRTGEVIALADNCVHKHERETDGRLVYNERAFAYCSQFKPDARLSSLDEAVMATQGAFGDHCPDFSTSGVVVSIQKGANNKEGE